MIVNIKYNIEATEEMGDSNKHKTSEDFNEAMMHVVVPEKCEYWKSKKSPLGADFVEVAKYRYPAVYSEEAERTLVRCMECDQLYVKDWVELRDSDNGNDSQYVNYIPVDSQRGAELVACISSIVEFDLFRPAFHYRFNSKADKPSEEWLL